MMPLWVPLLAILVTLVGAGALIAVSHPTGTTEQAFITIATVPTVTAVMVMVARLIPPALGGGAGHPVRDWVMLLSPWILTAVVMSGAAVRERLRPKRPPVPQADCSRCRAELYEDSTGRGRYYSANPVSYLCSERLQLPGNRRHDPVPRAIAASVRD